MQIAYLLYDRFTALDITGPHDVLNSVPGNESIFVAEHAGPIRNESDTLSLVADASLDEVTQPGHRRRPRRLRQPDAARARAAPRVDQRACTRPAPGRPPSAPARCCWPRPVCSTAPPRRPTGWPATVLAELGAKPVPDRVVEHGKIVTAAGVSSGIDMALHLVQQDQRRADRPGGPTRHRVRPAAAARRRRAGEGAAGGGRAGHGRLRGPGVGRRARVRPLPLQPARSAATGRLRRAHPRIRFRCESPGPTALIMAAGAGHADALGRAQGPARGLRATDDRLADPRRPRGRRGPDLRDRLARSRPLPGPPRGHRDDRAAARPTAPVAPCARPPTWSATRTRSSCSPATRRCSAPR